MAISQIKKFLEELGGQATIIDLLVCAVGLFLLFIWLIRTSLGKKALDNAPVRLNFMPPIWALIPFFLWVTTVYLLFFIKQRFFTQLSYLQNAVTENLILCIAVIPAIVTALMIAKISFVGGLKGLGLNLKTIGRDIASAFLNLFTVMPVVLAAIILTTIAGKLIIGDKFKIPQHEELKEIIEFSQWQVRALIIFTAIVLVPFVEELIFRGMIQTMLRNYLKPWPAIFISSFIFVIFHANPEHWLALFALAACLGYSYEKSGSLLRPIFVHAMFNAMSVLAALNQ